MTLLSIHIYDLSHSLNTRSTTRQRIQSIVSLNDHHPRSRYILKNLNSDALRVLFFEDVVFPTPALDGTALASSAASAMVSPLNWLRTLESVPLRAAPEST